MQKERCYEVTTTDGEIHRVLASFAFDNSARGEGLTFRAPDPDSVENKTRVVASFAQGAWRYYKEIQPVDGQD